MRYFIDVDGVLTDFVGGFLTCYDQHGGEIPEGFEVTSWTSIDFLPSRMALDMAWNDWDLMRYLPPVMDNIDAVQELLEDQENEVYLATAIAQHHIFGRLHWLERTMPWFPKDHVIFCSHKHVLAGDMLVDDNVTNLVAWCTANPDGVGVLIDRPYNRVWASALKSTKNWIKAPNIATATMSGTEVAL